MTRASVMKFNGSLVLDDDWIKFDQIEVGDLFCFENPRANSVSFDRSI